MKKLWVLGLAAIMTFACASLSMASTLGVNVNQGTSLSIEREDIDRSATTITLNAGLSDQLLLGLGYVTSDDYYIFGGRYEIHHNLAFGFNYYSEPDGADDDAYSVDLRGIYDFSKQLALTGKVSYIDKGYNEVIGLLGQVEYAVTDSFIPTFAVAYSEPDEGDSSTDYIFGMDIYPTDVLCVYLDYTVNEDDSDNNTVYLGLEFAL